MKLLLSQKNELFKIIQINNFSPNQFSYEEIKNDINDKEYSAVSIAYKLLPEFNFKMTSPSSSYMIDYSPGVSTIFIKTNYQSWDNTCEIFNKWLLNLKREISEEDLWGNLVETLKGIGDNIINNDVKFTHSQFQVVTYNMKQLQTKISTLSLPIDDINAINQKLDSILEQGKTLSKFDWQAQLVGALITILIALSITPEMGKEIWFWVKEIFSGIVLIQ